MQKPNKNKEKQDQYNVNVFYNKKNAVVGSKHACDVKRMLWLNDTRSARLYNSLKPITINSGASKYISRLPDYLQRLVFTRNVGTQYIEPRVGIPAPSATKFLRQEATLISAAKSFTYLCDPHQKRSGLFLLYSR